MRNLEWAYRTPPIRSWWRVIADAVAPAGEVAVIGLGMAVVYYLAILITVL